MPVGWAVRDDIVIKWFQNHLPVGFLQAFLRLFVIDEINQLYWEPAESERFGCKIGVVNGEQ